MRIRLFAFILLSTVVTSLAQAELVLPRNLNRIDRLKTLEIVGPSLSSKILGSPYALGGFSGWEVGFGTSIISTKDLSTIGSKPNTASESTVPFVSLGKGLFYNFDMYLEFSPIQSADDIQIYGGSLRWTFWEAKYIPAYMVVQIASNFGNIQDLMTINNTSGSIIGAFHVNKVTLYAGMGEIRTQGNFIGGANGLNSESISIQEEVQTNHSFAGLNFAVAKAFVALQLDRYNETAYSGRLGWRY